MNIDLANGGLTFDLDPVSLTVNLDAGDSMTIDPNVGVWYEFGADLDVLRADGGADDRESHPEIIAKMPAAKEEQQVNAQVFRLIAR